MSDEGEPVKYDAGVARRHGVEPDLLEAMLRVESGSRAHRISLTRACGPEQLMPGTAGDPRDFPDIDRAGCGIPGGAGALHGTIPQNGETEIYVPRVLAQARAIRIARTRRRGRP